MNIKYDNSMYTTIPPEEFIAENICEDDLKTAIDNHNAEMYYENQNHIDFDAYESTIFNELIKHEQSQIQS